MKILALTVCVLASAVALPAQAAGVLVGTHLDDVTIVYRDSNHYGYRDAPRYGWSYDTRVNYRYPYGYHPNYDYQRPVVIYYRDENRNQRHHRRHHHSRHCRH